MLTVMLVEDETLAGILVKAQAERLGIDLIWAKTLPEAEEAFDANQSSIQAIFFDGWVPNRNSTSVSLVKRIKEKGFEGPMFCATAIADLIEELMDAGCTETIRKDQIPDILEQIVREG